MIKIKERNKVNVEMTQEELAALETLLNNCTTSEDGSGIPYKQFQQLKDLVTRNKMLCIHVSGQELMYMYCLVQHALRDVSSVTSTLENMNCSFEARFVVESMIELFDDIVDSQEMWNAIQGREE